MTNEFKILLIIVIFLLAISIGLNAFSGRYTFQIEETTLIKLDTWTGRVFLFGPKYAKDGWLQLPNEFKALKEWGKQGLMEQTKQIPPKE